MSVTLMPPVLADIPGEWLSAELVAAYAQRDQYQAGTAAVQAVVDQARAARDDALSAVMTSGDPLAIGTLIRASGDLQAAEAALACLPRPTLDLNHLQTALDAANTALDTAGRLLRVATLDYETEAAAWRAFTMRNPAAGVVDPPIATDIERDVGRALEVIRTRVADWNEWRRRWSSGVQAGNIEAIDLLRSAVGYVAMATELGETVAEMNHVVAQTNGTRRGKKLTWSPTRATVGV